MKLNSINPASAWKMVLKVSAVGLSLVFITYALVWLLLSTISLFVEGLYP
ncbi:MAG: hypothetical protein K2X48_16730 [Chitinophagaceae bacterium]|nr:hypothetical protein [Chitinophagaceae bacterium]